MITQKQLRIFQVFAKEPFATYTLKQIKEIAGEKSNNALSIAMKQFKQENLLKEQKVGKSSLYTLNLDNEVACFYLALANHSRLSALAHRAVHEIKTSIERHTKFYSIAVFGSYAMQKQKRGSDLDVAVFIEAEDLRKNISRALKDAALKSPLDIDCHVITKKEFLEMLGADADNLGKEIARKHIAVHNHQIFYALLQEGMKRGFNV